MYTDFEKKLSVYIQCKGDTEVVDIKQHISQFKNSNFTITQSVHFFWTVYKLNTFYINICSSIAVESNLELNKIWQYNNH